MARARSQGNTEARPLYLAAGVLGRGHGGGHGDDSAFADKFAGGGFKRGGDGAEGRADLGDIGAQGRLQHTRAGKFADGAHHLPENIGRYVFP